MNGAASVAAFAAHRIIVKSVIVAAATAAAAQVKYMQVSRAVRLSADSNAGLIVSSIEGVISVRAVTAAAASLSVSTRSRVADTAAAAAALFTRRRRSTSG